jgi:hypothetical protein
VWEVECTSGVQMAGMRRTRGTKSIAESFTVSPTSFPGTLSSPNKQLLVRSVPAQYLKGWNWVQAPTNFIIKNGK